MGHLIKILVLYAVAIVNLAAFADSEAPHHKVDNGHAIISSPDYAGCMDAKSLGDGQREIRITRTCFDHAKGRGQLAIAWQAASSFVKDAEGEWLGLQISDIEPGSIFDLAGIRNHDVVTHVLGHPLSSPELGIHLLQRVKDMREWTFTVRKPIGRWKAWTPPIVFHVRVT